MVTLKYTYINKFFEYHKFQINREPFGLIHDNKMIMIARYLVEDNELEY